MLLSFLIVLGLWSQPGSYAYGAEIDNLTMRYRFRRSALPRLDRVMNERFQLGVAAANADAPECDAQALYEELKDAFGQSFRLVGHRIAKQLREDVSIPQLRVELPRSVYRELPFFSGISMHLADLMSTVRIGRYDIGLDKFGHFFAQGWEYFEIAYLDNGGLEQALAWGEQTERGKYGLVTTGIYSYADLVANFNGLRFWLRVLGENPDPLGSSEKWRPYVVCHDGQWLLQEKLRFRDYVDGAWDEGINCSAFSSPENQARVTDAVRGLERRFLYRFDCPAYPPACEVARSRYGPYAPHLLHPRCLDASERWHETLLRWARHRLASLWNAYLSLFDWASQPFR